MSKMSSFLHILQTVAPLVLLAIPGKGGDIARALGPKIIDGIAEAQQIPGATGAEKKSHVMDIVQDGLDSIQAEGHLQVPQADALATASSAIDTIVGASKVIDGTHKAVPQV